MWTTAVLCSCWTCYIGSLCFIFASSWLLRSWDWCFWAVKSFMTMWHCCCAWLGRSSGFGWASKLSWIAVLDSMLSRGGCLCCWHLSRMLRPLMITSDSGKIYCSWMAFLKSESGHYVGVSVCCTFALW